MTDDGQAQNSCSNLAGQKGHGGRQGFLPPSISKSNFVGPALSLVCVFKTLEKL